MTVLPDPIKCSGFYGFIEDVSCPICEPPPEPILIFKRHDGIGFWNCPQCGVMYASPRFTEESLLDIYEKEAFVDSTLYDNWSYEKWKRENRGRSYVVQHLKVQLVKRFLTKNDKILDFGCGAGLFCLEASKQGLWVEGIDPSKMLTDLGREKFGLALHNERLENFEPEYRYNGIVSWAVLEHVYNLKELVERCWSLLTVGGFLFIDVPNHEGPSNRFKTFLCRSGLKRDDFKHFGFPWHIYSFSKKSLSCLMNACGFEPIVFEFWSHLLKDGKEGVFPKMGISMSQRFGLSDYIVLVAQKRATNSNYL